MEGQDPDHIAYGMFHIFDFGQLVVGSDKVSGGQIADVRQIGVPVHILKDADGVRALQKWIDINKLLRVRKYLGAD